METGNKYDVIIIGGSFAGLSGAMALGRARRKVLIIDSGKPCNRQTPHAHNFITHDGESPAAISANAKQQVLKYPTIQFVSDKAIKAQQTENVFSVETAAGEQFTAKKLLVATGVHDIMPAIPGFAECWGISVLHCPYCHGYEVIDQPLGVLENGEVGFNFAMMINHWSANLGLFTNGPSLLTPEQADKLRSRGIEIIEKEIGSFVHTAGQMNHIVFTDRTQHPLSAMFAKPAFTQHSDIPAALGCDLNEQGYIVVDDFQKTSIPGVFAAGDNTSMRRALSTAIAAGNSAGAFINHELIAESY